MEFELINWLRTRLPRYEQLLVGIGDDAAILKFAADTQCVMTSDTLTDGVDFELSHHSARRVGRKALAANLSDLAAMAAEPVAALVSLVLPRTSGKTLAFDLYEGLIPLAEQFHVAIAGGDTNSWDGRLVISITAIGRIAGHSPLLRSGARPGDQILVTGSFGGSILGKHLDFQPRVAEALLLAAIYDLHAAIDVSDGLSLDLSRIAQESQCGAVLELDSIPIADAAHQLAATSAGGPTALEHALGDGEDFELILAAPADEARRLLAEQPLDTPITRIGQFIDKPGLWKIASGGGCQPLVPQGYEHRIGAHPR
jgi:thiamine-monophosphate kinase